MGAAVPVTPFDAITSCDSLACVLEINSLPFAKKADLTPPLNADRTNHRGEATMLC